MKRKSQLAIQIKKTATGIISGRLAKVNSWEEAKVNFNDLPADDQLDILEEVQKAMDAEVKKQFEKVQKAKTFLNTRRAA